MSQAPSMPLFVDAYLADTMHLSTEEHGAYLLLLMAMWRRNGAVPNDNKDLARMVRMSLRKWLAVKRRLMPLLRLEGEELTQKRLQKEWSYVREFSKKQSQNASELRPSARNKNNDIGLAKAQPKPSPQSHTHSSVPNGTGEEPPDEQKALHKRVVDFALPILKAQGETEGAARSAIGSFRRAYGNDDASLLADMQEISTASPASFKTTMFGRINRANRGPPQSWQEREQAQRDEFMANFRKRMESDGCDGVH